MYACILYTLQAGVGRPPRDLTDLLQDMMTAEVTGSSDLKENKAETACSLNYEYRAETSQIVWNRSRVILCGLSSHAEGIVLDEAHTFCCRLMRPTRLDLGLSVLCVFCPCPPCCLPALSDPVLTGELLKTAIGYTVLLPNYQICTCYLSNKPFFILHKCYKCIVPLLLVRNKNLCLMSYVWGPSLPSWTFLISLSVFLISLKQWQSRTYSTCRFKECLNYGWGGEL